LQTASSAALAVFVLFVLTRLIGKKQMSQLTFFDYVIGISIGSIASEYAIHTDVGAKEGITALVVFTLFSFLVSIVSVKSYIGRKLLDGTPTVIIENGKIIEDGLKKTKLTINDLLEECRQKDVFDIAEIEYAILETSGKLSVLLKSQNQPLTSKDMSLQTEYKGLCANVIIDGKVIHEHLRAIDLDENWLRDELSKLNFESCASVLLAYVDSAGMLVVHPKNVGITKEGFIID